METLKIYQVYKFKKGRSEFYISEGQDLKVRLSSGGILEGTLIEVGSISECFDIKTNDGIVTVDCENVVEIMPI